MVAANSLTKLLNPREESVYIYVAKWKWLFGKEEKDIRVSEKTIKYFLSARYLSWAILQKRTNYEKFEIKWTIYADSME